MLNDYSKRAKTGNVRINITTNQNQGPQINNYRKIYKNKSPKYYKHERSNNAVNNNITNNAPYTPYIKRIHYYQKQKNLDDYSNDKEKLEKNVKNSGSHDAYFHSGYKNMKESDEKGKNLIQRSVNTFSNNNQNKLPGRYYNLGNKNNNNNNMVKPQNEKQFINYKKINDNQRYEGGQQKYSPKFFRNNIPLINSKIQRVENVIQPVAQKICNIIIKGEKNKKLNKSGKKFANNIEIEGNMAKVFPVPDKIIDFNITSSKNNY